MTLNSIKCKFIKSGAFVHAKDSLPVHGRVMKKGKFEMKMAGKDEEKIFKMNCLRL